MNDNFTRNFSTRSNNVNNIERKSHNFSTNQKRLPTDWFARKGQQAIRKIFIGNFTPSQFTPYDRIWIGESMAAILILKNEFRSKRDPLFIVESNNIISIDVRSFEKKKKKESSFVLRSFPVAEGKWRVAIRFNKNRNKCWIIITKKIITKRGREILIMITMIGKYFEF